MTTDTHNHELLAERHRLRRAILEAPFDPLPQNHPADLVVSPAP